MHFAWHLAPLVDPHTPPQEAEQEIAKEEAENANQGAKLQRRPSVQVRIRNLHCASAPKLLPAWEIERLRNLPPSGCAPHAANGLKRLGRAGHKCFDLRSPEQ